MIPNETFSVPRIPHWTISNETRPGTYREKRLQFFLSHSDVATANALLAARSLHNSKTVTLRQLFAKAQALALRRFSKRIFTNRLIILPFVAISNIDCAITK